MGRFNGYIIPYLQMSVIHPMQQVYLLKDYDMNLYKIGLRSIGSPRFLKESSLIKNGYATNIKQVICSVAINKELAAALESVLHSTFSEQRVKYPATTITTTLPNGSTKSIQRSPNGHTEWFNLTPEDVALCTTIIEAT